jgi:hypothetical protein
MQRDSPVRNRWLSLAAALDAAGRGRLHPGRLHEAKNIGARHASGAGFTPIKPPMLGLAEYERLRRDPRRGLIAI